MPEPKNILVTACCQTPGLVSALKLLLPRTKIHAAVSVSKATDKLANVSRYLEAMDAWINVEGGEGFYSGGDFAQSHPRLVYVSIPLLEFGAFHPDMYGVNDGTGNSKARIKRSSLIGAWAYWKRLPPAKAADLFNPSTFGSLGYLSRWGHAVDRLKGRFAASCLKDDFDVFYRRIKRQGLFMYTPSHPKPELLAELAKLVALKLGREQSVLGLELEALDTLSSFVWPLYPEIARRLSIRASGYMWRMAFNECVEGLEPFLAYSFALYQSKGITPANIRVSGVNFDELEHAIVSRG